MLTCCFFFNRDDYYDRERSENEDEEKDNAGQENIIEVLIEKNRSGARGTVKALVLIKEYNKFSSLSYFPERYTQR